MINKVILVGNLGADPETRTAGTGNMVANLRVATNSRERDRDGNWQDHTEWHRVVCFGKTAENTSKFLRKGSKVYVEGRIRTNKWKNKEGQDQYTTEILADLVRFLDSKGGGGGGNGGGSYGGGGGGYDGGGGGGGGGGGYEGGGGGGGGGGSGPDDDIPF